MGQPRQQLYGHNLILFILAIGEVIGKIDDLFYILDFEGMSQFTDQLTALLFYLNHDHCTYRNCPFAIFLRGFSMASR